MKKNFGLWSSNSESDVDRSLRHVSEIAREARTLDRNHDLIGQGQPLQHCGVPASRNALGDWECNSCGDVFA